MASQLPTRHICFNIYDVIPYTIWDYVWCMCVSIHTHTSYIIYIYIYLQYLHEVLFFMAIKREEPKITVCTVHIKMLTIQNQFKTFLFAKTIAQTRLRRMWTKETFIYTGNSNTFKIMKILFQLKSPAASDTPSTPHTASEAPLS